VDLALVHVRRDGLEYRRRMMEVVDMTLVIRMGGILDEHDGVEQQLLGQVRSGQARPCQMGSYGWLSAIMIAPQSDGRMVWMPVDAWMLQLRQMQVTRHYSAAQELALHPPNGHAVDDGRRQQPSLMGQM